MKGLIFVFEIILNFDQNSVNFEAENHTFLSG